MKKLSSILLILLASCATITVQERFPITDIYWSSDRQIQFSDYQAMNDACIEFNERLGLHTISDIGLRGIVDIPRRWRGRNAGRLDRGYIVPFFCRECSCIFYKDSLSLKVDHLIFDTAELFARRIRRELRSIQVERNIRNPNSMFFTTVRNQNEEEMRRVFGQIFRDVLIDKRENAYEKWREQIDELLEETIEFITTDEDRRRFTSGRPIVEGYIEARTIAGDLRSIGNTN